ncbi:MAG: hypothetical protein FK730_05380 [Asgard group archaeon]|nr:hypothetical protein [Asgard group archaeon]
MEKFLRLSISRMSIIFLISAVFLSIHQHEFLTKYNLAVTCSEVVTETYPKLNFSTFLGGDSGGEIGSGIAVANDGNYYVTGQTKSNDFPTQNAYNSTYSGNNDAFVVKFDRSNSLLWSTYFGGSDTDYSDDIAIAGDDSCYITGFTRSSDFPTQNAFNSTHSGDKDAFLAKFSSNGSLLWSSYLGGNDSDWSHSIAVANDGSCYVTGVTFSDNFPTKNAYDSTFNGGNLDVFVTKFAADGTLLWSSYLGGNSNEVGNSIAVTTDGGCYVTGWTWSSNFPTLYAYDTTSNGDFDVFVTKFNASGSLLWSTFLGGAWWDEALGITAASDDSCYLTGLTASIDFPTHHAFNSTYGDWGDVFLTKFASNGSLLWSTFLGGNNSDYGYDVAVTSDGSCYVTGETGSNNFPIQNAYSNSLAGFLDTFITKFSSDGSLLWSTFLGGSQTDEAFGIAVTTDGSCYIIGSTFSPDFPTLNAFDNILGATSDVFIAKFDDSPLSTTSYRAFYGFFAFVVFIPIIILIYYKKRK